MSYLHHKSASLLCKRFQLGILLVMGGVLRHKEQEGFSVLLKVTKNWRLLSICIFEDSYCVFDQLPANESEIQRYTTTGLAILPLAEMGCGYNYACETFPERNVTIYTGCVHLIFLPR